MSAEVSGLTVSSIRHVHMSRRSTKDYPSYAFLYALLAGIGMHYFEDAVGRCVERRIATRALADARAEAPPCAGLHDEECGSCDGTDSVLDDGAAVDAPPERGRSVERASDVFPPEEVASVQQLVAGSDAAAAEVAVEVTGHAAHPDFADAASLPISRITNPVADLSSPDEAEGSPAPLRGGMRRGEVRTFEPSRHQSGSHVNATDGPAPRKSHVTESRRRGVDPSEQHLQHHHALDHHHRPAPAAAAGPEMLLHVHAHGGHSHTALHHDVSGASPLLGGSLATRARFVVAAILLEFGVGVHSVFIGLAVGVLSDSNLSALLVALCFHQVRRVCLIHVHDSHANVGRHTGKDTWRAPAPLHSFSKGSRLDPASWMLLSRLHSSRLPCAPPSLFRRPWVSQSALLLSARAASTRVESRFFSFRCALRHDGRRCPSHLHLTRCHGSGTGTSTLTRYYSACPCLSCRGR